MSEDLKQITPEVYEVPLGYKPGMRVPGRIYVDSNLLRDIDQGTVAQVANVACLPGVVKYSMAMPDAHLGYGFPIGGVAGFDANDGVISPGGIGYDINCGVRLLRTNLDRSDVEDKLSKLIDTAFRNVPSGLGSKGKIRLDSRQIDEVLEEGAAWAVGKGYGWEADLDHMEENGRLDSADASKVSHRAKQRGIPQLGSLGSGNHFLEIQYVDQVYDEEAARTMGIDGPGQITTMIHTGSRGCGHQICSDYLRVMESAIKKYRIGIPDRELACAPTDSPEAEAYFSAMSAGANFAWGNRQMIMHWIRESFEQVLGQSAESLEMNLIYDVAHNIGKRETHIVNGEKMELYVHRKGATRSFGPGEAALPTGYSDIGQPVIVPGDMGTASYLMAGTRGAMENTFGSTCHGAGRFMSRAKAKRQFYGEKVQSDLRAKGILVRAASMPVIAEEAPGAYKDIDNVVEVCHRAGISRKVARLRPLAVAKG
ncbi:MAG: RtcB family protein [Theionarchaea archaeon]|nr:RtcB family protein [Theionarchaea archaeon]